MTDLPLLPSDHRSKGEHPRFWPIDHQVVVGNDTVPVTKLQDAMIVGSLLGDAHMQKTRASTQRCRLRVCHNVAQRRYVDWKHSILLDPFCTNTQLPYETSRPGEYQFYTMYTNSFSSYHSTWYMRREASKYLKVVPSNIQELLTDPISLAVWYLDDGSKRKDCEACRLATMGFSHRENIELVECLRANFGLEAKVGAFYPNRVGGPLYGLSFSSKASGYKRLKSLIHPFVEAEVPSMLYKLQ